MEQSVKDEIRAGEKTIILYSESQTAPLVLLNTVDGEGEKVFQAVKGLTDKAFSFACIDGLDWNNELSPWAIPSVVKGDKPFSGGADKYLQQLTGDILSQIMSQMDKMPTYIALTGYSLAGLFALYAAYKTDKFSRIACGSGSFWYPDFVDFVRENKMCREPERLYFSLGNKEAKTRNKVLQTVEVNTSYLAEYYSKMGIKTLFELNVGNHFYQESERMAKAIAWLLK